MKSDCCPFRTIVAATIVAVGLIFDVHHLLEGPLARLIGYGVEAAAALGVTLDRHARATGQVQPGLLAGGLGGLAVAVTGFVALRSRRGRAFHRMLGPLAAAVLLAVAFDSLGYAAGVGLPLAAGALLLLALAVQSLRARPLGQALLSAAFWAGLAWLVTGGVALLLGLSGQHTIADHAQLGLLWTPFLVAWCVDHLQKVDGESGGALRWSGLAAVALFLLEAASGLARLLLPGEAWLAGAGVHAALGGGALLLSFLHVGLRVAGARRSARPRRPEGRPGGATAALMALAAVLSLHASWVERPDAPDAEARVAAGRAADTLHPATIGEGASALGCGAATGCHAAQQGAWEGGAHAQSASPIYSAVADQLAAESGSAAVGACATCHAPAAVLTGTDPHQGPLADTGVGCGTCHGLQPGTDIGNGEGMVRGDPALPSITEWQSTAYLSVKQHKREHVRTWRGSGLGSGDQCGTCHQLELQGVTVRDTHGEWEAAGAEQRCITCHMPRETEGPGSRRDHAMASGNVGLAGLDATAVAARTAFLASAVTLEAEVRGPLLVARLQNIGSGHGFPTAPLDLVQYQLQAEAPDGTWHPLHGGSLFPQTLVDVDGKALRGHELWATAALQGATRILPDEHRSWTLEVPAAVGPGPVPVRLVHWRVAPGMQTPGMAKYGANLEPVVLFETLAAEAQARNQPAR